jgi:hypothetical protein
VDPVGQAVEAFAVDMVVEGVHDMDGGRGDGLSVAAQHLALPSRKVCRSAASVRSGVVALVFEGSEEVSGAKPAAQRVVGLAREVLRAVGEGQAHVQGPRGVMQWR